MSTQLNTETSVAKELEDRFLVLSDPKVRWVRGVPERPGQSCLVADCFWDKDGWRDFKHRFSFEALLFLEGFVADYLGTDHEYFDPIDFNDKRAKSRKEVLWMLEEAIEEAKELGL